MSRPQPQMVPSRRERAKASKRRRIAEAAAELFRSRGFDAVSTDEIAARADVAKGTVFRYAPTKAQLLLLVYESRLEAAVEHGFASLNPAGVIDQELAALFLRFLRLYDDDPDLGRRFVREVLLLPPATEDPGYDLTVRFIARLADTFAGWQSDGRLAADVDPRLAAQSTFSLYYGTLAGWLNGQLSAAERDDALRRSIALHCRGMLAAAPAKRARSRSPARGKRP